MSFFDFLKPKKSANPNPDAMLRNIATPHFSGGDGRSQEEAVVITAPTTISGVAGEYLWLEMRCGKRDEKWTLKTRSLVTTSTGKKLEIFVITFKNGEERVIYFDITAFYGRSLK